MWCTHRVVLVVEFETDAEGVVTDGRWLEGDSTGNLQNVGSAVSQSSYTPVEGETYKQVMLTLPIKHKLLPNQSWGKLEIFCGQITDEALGR